MPSSATTLIVGATSSLMQALARVLAAEGHALALAGRDVDELELLAADLRTRFAADCRLLPVDFMAQGFFAPQLIEQAGPFGHAVIGVGDMGSGDAADPANLAYVAHVNYTLPAQIAAAAAEYLSAKPGGSVVIISSVAGDRGRQSNIAYGAAKAALSAFASGLRNRYARRGVHVMTVKPGFVDTPMTWGMKSPLIATRESVARAIAAAMRRRRDVVYVPAFWRLIMFVIRLIPEKIFKRLKL